ncbi:TPA: acyltransferase [Raoultella ornithinolytica]|uniref:acyltransferase n=1 Tax=Raoultella ornithinolytica TaxID=54291 RepID=UPI002DE27EC8|nr:acyltransferase [Raoultella ornithinolytica]MEC5111098.1 acyltransferase [Raoultella ornithinolytica]HCE8951671.1 acyltransferase [Raoultella ornithinolytica]
MSIKRENPDIKKKPVVSLIRDLVRFWRYQKISILNRKKISRGNNCYFGPGANVYIPDSMKIGNNVSVGADFISQVNLSIGDECLISSRVSFIGNDHELFNENSTAYFSGRNPPSKIVLEGDNFIGFGSVILGNVTIGRGAVVAACSFVNKDVPPNTVVGGVPAKVLRTRY